MYQHIPMAAEHSGMSRTAYRRFFVARLVSAFLIGSLGLPSPAFSLRPENAGMEGSPTRRKLLNELVPAGGLEEQEISDLGINGMDRFLANLLIAKASTLPKADRLTVTLAHRGQDRTLTFVTQHPLAEAWAERMLPLLQEIGVVSETAPTWSLRIGPLSDPAGEPVSQETREVFVEVSFQPVPASGLEEGQPRGIDIREWEVKQENEAAGSSEKIELPDEGLRIPVTGWEALIGEKGLTVLLGKPPKGEHPVVLSHGTNQFILTQPPRWSIRWLAGWIGSTSKKLEEGTPLIVGRDPTASALEWDTFAVYDKRDETISRNHLEALLTVVAGEQVLFLRNRSARLPVLLYRRQVELLKRFLQGVPIPAAASSREPLIRKNVEFLEKHLRGLLNQLKGLQASGSLKGYPETKPFRVYPLVLNRIGRFVQFDKLSPEKVGDGWHSQGSLHVMANGSVVLLGAEGLSEAAQRVARESVERFQAAGLEENPTVLGVPGDLLGSQLFELLQRRLAPLENQLAPVSIGTLVFILGEILDNLNRHAYHQQGSFQTQVTIAWDETEVRVTLEDQEQQEFRLLEHIRLAEGLFEHGGKVEERRGAGITGTMGFPLLKPRLEEGLFSIRESTFTGQGNRNLLVFPRTPVGLEELRKIYTEVSRWHDALAPASQQTIDREQIQEDLRRWATAPLFNEKLKQIAADPVFRYQLRQNLHEAFGVGQHMDWKGLLFWQSLLNLKGILAILLGEDLKGLGVWKRELQQIGGELTQAEWERLLAVQEIQWNLFEPKGQNPLWFGEQGHKIRFLPSDMLNAVRLLKRAGLDKGGRLLELGSGTGDVVIPAAAVLGANVRGYEAIGRFNEVAMRWILEARQRGLIDLAQRVEVLKMDFTQEVEWPEVDVIYLFLDNSLMGPHSELTAEVERRLLEYGRNHPGVRVVIFGGDSLPYTQERYWRLFTQWSSEPIEKLSAVILTASHSGLEEDQLAPFATNAEAMKQLDELEAVIRLRRRHFQKGALLDLRRIKEPLPNLGLDVREVLVVSDLHNHRENLEAIVHHHQKELEEGKVILLNLGDVKPWAPAEYRSRVRTEGSREIAKSSAAMDQYLAQLQIKYPNRIFSLLGNHDLLDKSTVPSDTGKRSYHPGNVLREFLTDAYSPEYLARYERDFIQRGPIFAVGPGFMAAHGGSPFSAEEVEDFTTRNQMFRRIARANVRSKKDPIVQRMVWSRYREASQGFPFLGSDAQAILAKGGIPAGVFFIGHSHGDLVDPPVYRVFSGRGNERTDRVSYIRLNLRTGEARHVTLPVSTTGLEERVIPLEAIQGASSWADKNLFGNEGPVELEIAFGDGVELKAQGETNPGVNFLGVEFFSKQMYDEAWASQFPQNVKFVLADIQDLLSSLPSGLSSFRRIWNYFPDGRYSMDPIVWRELLTSLAPDGELHLETEIEPAIDALLEAVRQIGQLHHLRLRLKPRASPTVQGKFLNEHLDEGRPIEIYEAVYTQPGVLGAVPQPEGWEARIQGWIRQLVRGSSEERVRALSVILAAPLGKVRGTPSFGALLSTASEVVTSEARRSLHIGRIIGKIPPAEGPAKVKSLTSEMETSRQAHSLAQRFLQHKGGLEESGSQLKQILILGTDEMAVAQLAAAINNLRPELEVIQAVIPRDLTRILDGLEVGGAVHPELVIVANDRDFYQTLMGDYPDLQLLHTSLRGSEALFVVVPRSVEAAADPDLLTQILSETEGMLSPPSTPPARESLQRLLVLGGREETLIRMTKIATDWREGLDVRPFNLSDTSALYTEALEAYLSSPPGALPQAAVLTDMDKVSTWQIWADTHKKLLAHGIQISILKPDTPEEVVQAHLNHFDAFLQSAGLEEGSSQSGEEAAGFDPKWVHSNTFKAPHFGDVRDHVLSLAFGPAGKGLYSRGYAGTTLWFLPSGNRWPLGAPVPGTRINVYSMAVSPDGRIAEGLGDGRILLREQDPNPFGVPPTARYRILAGHDHEVWSLAFSPDGTVLASGDLRGVIKLWSIATGRLLRTLPGHTGVVRGLAFSPDGRTLASGSHDGTIRFWRVVEPHDFLRPSWFLDSPLLGLSLVKKQILYLGPPGTFQQSVAFRPDGSLLVSGSANGNVTIWDVATGKFQQALVPSSEYETVLDVAFSPDGKTIAFSKGIQGAQLWNLETETQTTLPTPVLPVLSVAFAPDGTLALGSVGQIQLWKPVGTVPGPASTGLEEENLTQVLKVAEEATNPERPGVLVIGEEAFDRNAGLEEFVLKAQKKMARRLVAFGVAAERAARIRSENPGVTVVESKDSGALIPVLLAMPEADVVTYLGSQAVAQQITQALQQLLVESITVFHLDPDAAVRFLLKAVGVDEKVIQQLEEQGLEERVRLQAT